MKTYKRTFAPNGKLLIFSVLIFSVFTLKAQQGNDVMFKKTIVRAIDLREKQNEGIFSKNKEITKWILDAVLNGEVKPYTSDSLCEVQPMSVFSNSLKIPNSGTSFNPNNPTDTVDAYLAYGEDWRDYIMPSVQYSARDLYQLELKEEVFFDKNKSTMKYKVLAVTIYIPADHPSNLKGIQLPLASFDYQELVEKVFSNSNAIWYNTQNEAQHKNLAEAFELRLFSSYIIKVGNAKDAYLADIYKDQHKGIMASQWAAMELLEYEHNLWEF
ncbi:MAG: gliding motility protein GldN [Cytophagaceae bacterium]